MAIVDVCYLRQQWIQNGVYRRPLLTFAIFAESNGVHHCGRRRPQYLMGRVSFIDYCIAYSSYCVCHPMTRNMMFNVKRATVCIDGHSLLTTTYVGSFEIKRVTPVKMLRKYARFTLVRFSLPCGAVRCIFAEPHRTV